MHILLSIVCLRKSYRTDPSWNWDREHNQRSLKWLTWYVIICFKTFCVVSGYEFLRVFQVSQAKLIIYQRTVIYFRFFGQTKYRSFARRGGAMNCFRLHLRWQRVSIIINPRITVHAYKPHRSCEIFGNAYLPTQITSLWKRNASLSNDAIFYE